MIARARRTWSDGALSRRETNGSVSAAGNERMVDETVSCVVVLKELRWLLKIGFEKKK